MLTSMYCPETVSASWVPFAGMLTGWLVRPLFVLPFFVFRLEPQVCCHVGLGVVLCAWRS